MHLLLTLRIALRALGKNKLRAGLTVLGVVIGIAAVTTMVSLGESASGLVQGELQNLGTNVIIVFPGSRPSGGVREAQTVTLTAADSDAIARDCPAVLASTPLVGTAGQMIYGNTNWKPRQIQGVGPDYPIVRNWPLRAGAFFTDRDVSAAAKVCVIGHTVVARLFQTTNPVGETVRIRNIPFRVIGVLERKGANIGGDDQDDIVLLPYTTVQKRIQGSAFDNVGVILVSGRSPSQMADAENQIRHLLLERHRIPTGAPADFRVQNTTEIANTLGIITGTITLMLAAIAAISLVVGGVGIMNIMLVSVTERTREIGLRLAVGARPRDIRGQFLIEATTLATIGGALGVALGVGAAHAIARAAGWPSLIAAEAIVIAVAFSALVGIFFGFYPAQRAAKLDPIEALRRE
ncbi:MAG: ABC transporter permease [Microvirga sp.]